MRLITNSEMKCSRRCAREHLYRYELGYRSRQNAHALSFGDFFHQILERWWVLTGEQRLETALLFCSTSKLPGIDDFDRATASSLIRGYHERWKYEAIQPIVIEKEFEALLVNPRTGRPSQTFRLGGKIDAIAAHDDRVVLVEHKTTSEDIEQGSDYWKRLRLDSQISTYYVGARSLGYDVESCLYDVIRKPSLKPYKATPESSRKFTKDGVLYASQRVSDETPEEYGHRVLIDIAERPEWYFQRGTVDRLESDEEEAAYDVWNQSRQIRENEINQRYPRNPDNCIRWGRQCDYFPVCSGATTLENPSLFTKEDIKHPELTQSTQTISKLERVRKMQTTTITKAVRPRRMTLASITDGKMSAPERLVVYGPSGIGKSTMGADAPKPIFIPTEHGTSELDVQRFPLCETWTDALDAVEELSSPNHDRQTVVFDTITGLEPLLFRFLCETYGKTEIDQVAGGYGRGYEVAIDHWRGLLKRLELLQSKRGMHVVLLGHSVVRKYSDPNPTIGAYDRYTLNMYTGKNANASDLVQQWAQCVLFANHETVKTSAKQASFTGLRIAHTVRNASFDAKNRYNLPERIPLGWDSYQEARKNADPSCLIRQAKELIALIESETSRAKALSALERAGQDSVQVAKVTSTINATIEQQGEQK